MPTLFCIVEGYGERAAAPVLLRRLVPGLAVTKPWRVGAGKIFNRHWADLTPIFDAARLQGSDLVLLLLDTDCETRNCPKRVASALLAEMRAQARDLNLAMTLAECEFENWFIAAAESLRWRRPPKPEGIRDAKGWISKQMGVAYSPTLHQASFAAQMDLNECKAYSRSFRHLCKALEALPQ
ncbi:MAG: DUF4276 family protein [Terracidiphilus sp.]